MHMTCPFFPRHPARDIFSRASRGLLIALAALFWAEAPAMAAFETSLGVTAAMEQAKDQAAAFLRQGNAAEAYRMYSRLLREDPEDDAINLGLARAALAAQRLPQALFSLERLVDRHPADTALRLELVRLYLRAGDQASARAEMEQARLYDSALTAESADQTFAGLLRQAEARNSRWRFAGRVSGGVLYDSNVNSGLFGPYLRLSWLNLRMDDATLRQEAWGEYANAAIYGAWRMGEHSPWWVVGDVGAYAKAYQRKVSSHQSFQWGRVGLGLRRIGISTLVDMRFKAEQALYDPFRTVSLYGPVLTFACTPTPQVQLIASAGLEHRDYTGRNDQDGTYWSVGQSIRWLFGKQGGNGGHEVVAGWRWLGGDADASACDYRGWEASVRLVLRPWTRLEVSPFALWRQEDYRGTATELERMFRSPARKDRIFQTGTFFTWHWTRHWSQELGYQYVNNMSNSPFYKYDQHVFNTGVTWSF